MAVIAPGPERIREGTGHNNPEKGIWQQLWPSVEGYSQPEVTLKGGSQVITTLTSISFFPSISCQGIHGLNPVEQSDRWCVHTSYPLGQKARIERVDLERQIEDIWHHIRDVGKLFHRFYLMVLFFKMDITKPTLWGQLERIKWKCVYIALSIVPHTRAHLSVFFSGLLCPNMVVPSARYDPNTQSVLLSEICSLYFHRIVLAMFWEHRSDSKGFGPGDSSERIH